MARSDLNGGDVIDCIRSFWLVKGRHPPGCPRSSFHDVAVHHCQLCFQDGAHSRLHWRDKTCLARTELIMIWKASLFLLFLLSCQQDFRTTGADVFYSSSYVSMVCLLVSCRGAALVEVLVEIEGQTAFSHEHQSWLEVWTDDGSLPVSAHHYKRNRWSSSWANEPCRTGVFPCEIWQGPLWM